MTATVVKYFFCVSLLVLPACKQLSGEEKYFRYINDPENKISQHIKIGETTASMKFLTREYRQKSERGAGTSLNENEDDSFFYFSFHLDNPDLKKTEKSQAIYADFDIQRDFILYDGRDSMAAAICQKIETGLNGKYTYLLAFPKTGVQQMTVFYNDKLFGMGTIAFVFNKKDIDRIPALQTNLN